MAKCSKTTFMILCLAVRIFMVFLGEYLDSKSDGFK